jgi:serine/threonine protein kinase
MHSIMHNLYFHLNQNKAIY